ncbi:TPA: RHS repeat domain-containing protein, partial [Escherichia coli]
IRCILPPEDERDRHPDESLLKTTYRYNAAGELTEVILPGDETLTFSRDEAGREVFRHSNRGFACEQGWNAASQLVTQRAGFFPEETTWGGLLPSLVREYRYDSAGNVSGVTSREDYGRETRREYRLDRNGQVTAVTASGTGLGYGEGDESYGYDSCGYLKAQSAGRHRISEETDQYAGGHRLKQAGNTQYDYDAAGRMVSRTKHRDGYRPETERFRWDSRDQLTGYCSAQGELWEYRHDASGRRTEKRCDRKKIRFTYLWDGDSIAEIREYRDDKLYSVRHLVFNGFELISQQFSRERQAHPSVAPLWVTRTNHAVSDLTGRPLMLFNSEGKTVWRPGQTSLWGLALSLPADTGYPDPRGEWDPEADPGLLYAGQWQDAESGLCYNRFRYYEPETGMYLVSDPLGLQGGEQTYRYVPNPLGWIDSYGLSKGAVAAGVDVALVGKGDPLLKALPWIKKQDGVFDVLIHGSPDAFHVLHNGKYVQINHRTLANLIKKSGHSGEPIRLLSCSSGASPTAIAQHLSNKLGVPVTAPSDTLWIFPSGKITVGKTSTSNTGSWSVFEPRVTK